MPGADTKANGASLYALVEELYPIHRSITGDGVRATLEVLRRFVPIESVEVPTGTPVLDWEVPGEWNIRDAYVANGAGERVVDLADSTLHVVSYSVPVRELMPMSALRPHLHTLPEHPSWIPYRTSYWQESWGFCLAHETLESLPDGEYEVVVDSTLADGSLTYGELVLPGDLEDEVLVSCHVCHPALCNDGLSGIAVATFLAREIASWPARRLTYRFLFVPGTIGSITWLARNEASVANVRNGLVLACIGDPGPVTYKRSRRGDAEVDRAVAHVLARSGREHELRDFSPYGYDERQYCSPGFDLAVGCLMRTPYGEFPEYHTSADDLGLVTPEALETSHAICVEVMRLLDRNETYVNLSPKGEPQLGRRGLYGAAGGEHHREQLQLGLLWVLNLSDGGHDLLSIAERSGLEFEHVAGAAARLVDAGLLAPAGSAP
jgi:aminopeptidase-like protein